MTSKTKLRGKDVLGARRMRARLVAANAEHDGPWEPCIKVADGGFAWVAHDTEGRLDLHLPGDGLPFDEDAALAKLRIAEVVDDA